MAEITTVSSEHMVVHEKDIFRVRYDFVNKSVTVWRNKEQEPLTVHGLKSQGTKLSAELLIAFFLQDEKNNP